MRDLLLQFSGLVAMAAALAHGVLSETRMFPRVSIEPQRLRTLFRLVFQLPTVDWLCFGALLMAAPSMASEAARHWIVVIVVVAFASSALANALGTQGKHFGWIVLGAAAILAAAGY